MKRDRWKTALTTLGLIGSLGMAQAQGKDDISVQEARRYLKGFQKAVVAAARVANPAVVNISAEQPARRSFFDDFFGYGDDEATSKSLGSGVIIDANGVIVTNNHVIAGARKITISTDDNRTFDARVVGADPTTDLAVLKVDAKNLPALKWGNSDALEVGEFVIAIGNPFGLKQTVTSGIVSAKGRQDLGIEGIEDFIQTDAAINPGNSGGALIDLDGNLVGINTAIWSQSGSNNGIGFAIPSSMAKPVVSELLKYGKVQRGWVGFIPVEPRRVKGVYVQNVFRQSPASRAGIRPGERIIAVNDQQVQNALQLRRVVFSSRPGEKLTFKLENQEGERSLTITLDELPLLEDGKLIRGV